MLDWLETWWEIFKDSAIVFSIMLFWFIFLFVIVVGSISVFSSFTCS